MKQQQLEHEEILELGSTERPGKKKKKKKRRKDRQGQSAVYTGGEDGEGGKGGEGGAEADGNSSLDDSLEEGVGGDWTMSAEEALLLQQAEEEERRRGSGGILEVTVISARHLPKMDVCPCG